MEILFTTTDFISSELIREVTGEPVSHCAIKYNDFVIHSNFKGVVIEPYSYFLEKNEIKYKIDIPDNLSRLKHITDLYYGKLYDFGALFYLGFRLILPDLFPKKNLWQATGMFLCTEFITEFIDEKEDSLITPYKLYLRLKEENENGSN